MSFPDAFRIGVEHDVVKLRASKTEKRALRAITHGEDRDRKGAQEAMVGGWLSDLSMRALGGEVLSEGDANDILGIFQDEHCSNEQLFEIIRKVARGEAEEVCPIEGEVEPTAVTACGHCYDYETLFQYTTRGQKTRCPVCDKPLTPFLFCRVARREDEDDEPVQAAGLKRKRKTASPAPFVRSKIAYIADRVIKVRRTVVVVQTAHQAKAVKDELRKLLGRAAFVDLVAGGPMARTKTLERF